MKTIELTKADYDDIVARKDYYKKLLKKDAREGRPRPSEKTLLGKALILFTAKKVEIIFTDQELL